MKNFKSIYLATKNPNKLIELQQMINNPKIDLKLCTDLDPKISWEETGNSFKENALIKALAVKKYTDHAVLADDSGLVVNSLNGAPGVLSSRYAGPDKNDFDNIEKLLKELKNKEDRSASFICTLAYIDGGQYFYTGKCDGIISDKPYGDKGFGYDPVFYYKPKNKTFGQLSPKEKNSISHRYNAVLAWLKSI